jgi:hypothetical protein
MRPLASASRACISQVSAKGGVEDAYKVVILTIRRNAPSWLPGALDLEEERLEWLRRLFG